MTVSKAAKKFRTFHQKDPREVLEFKKDPWPKKWGLSGRATRIFYRSDKWERDGKFVDYYHDHGDGVKLWEPLGYQCWLEESSPGRGIPCKYATVLGYCLGWEIDRNGDQEHMAVEFGDEELLLCCTPSGKVLFVLDQNLPEVIAVFKGGDLSVEAEGIDG